MELGKIQRAWIESLRNHPEKQGKGILGNKNENKFCCLGQLLITSCKVRKKKIPFNKKGTLYDKESYTYLSNSYGKLGLYSNTGEFNENLKFKGFDNLAEANDCGATWLEIADFVEEYPAAVFTKSV